MPDLLRALLISGGLLLAVVVLIIIISIVAVNRGAAEMTGEAEAHHPPEPAVHRAGAAAAPAPAKAAAKAAAVPAGEEINVLQILGFGIALFALAVLGLFAVSLIAHL
jgi:hypothetical protein